MNRNQQYKKVLLLLVFSTLFFHLSAQFVNDCNYERPHEADQWIFGVRGGIDFMADPVTAAPTSSAFSLPNGVATLSYPDGRLRMFTNGIKVFNQGMYLMPNGDNLNGNNFATQSSLIVPHPGNTNLFYVFTVDMYIPPIFTDGVNYSIVDFTNNGFGEVTSKNNFLMGENAQKITGTKHSNGTEYWVVTHGFGPNKGNTFYSYLVSDTGLMTTPVTSKLGTVQQGDENNAAGYMKISPDGTKIALLIPSDGIAELYDFDASNGQVSNLRSSATGQFDYPFGLEFSPDNSKLYISTSPLGNGTNFLYQFDATAADPFANPTVIEQFDVNQVGGADSLMGALQLGVDGKIYMAKFKRGVLGMKYLGVVYNPNRPGLACNYNSLDGVSNNGFNLAGGESLIGLPNFLTNYLDVPHFTFIDQCLNDTTQFRITNQANINNTTWDFDDDEGEQISNDMFEPSYVFSDVGDYSVTLTESFGGVDYTVTENVRINPLPVVEIGFGFDTIFILPNTSVRLDAGEHRAYYWQPGGSTGRYYDVTAQGLYAVLVQDSNCCVNGDMVYVAYADLYYPNAFKPGSAIAENSVFKVVGNTAALAGYLLQVFDRWGGLVFETNNPNEGWDGNFEGTPVPVGTYVWRSVFSGYEINGESSGEIEKSGTVTVVR